jgi:hypothetical protein
VFIFLSTGILTSAQQWNRAEGEYSKSRLNYSLMDNRPYGWYSITLHIHYEPKMIGPTPYFSYENALSASRKLKKPVMVYFYSDL